MTGQTPSVLKLMPASKCHSNMVIHNINEEILSNFFVLFVLGQNHPYSIFPHDRAFNNF